MFQIRTLKIKKLSPQARIPQRGLGMAAGLDLYAARPIVIAAFSRATCWTDIAIELPAGCYGRIAPRSGIAARLSLDIGAGVIDPDYRGNIGVVMINHSRGPIFVPIGARIAQLICEQYIHAIPVEVERLTPTWRGLQGFGSSGI